MDQQPNQIDEYFFSRQLATYGFQMQKRISKLRVYQYGVAGLGIEVAKNLLLSGIAQLNIFDNTIIRQRDLGTNFFLRYQHIGKLTRAQASLSQLRKLNKKALLSVSQSSEITYISSNFDCVIVLDCFDRQFIIELNRACRQRKVGFVYAGCLGLYGFTFVDFVNHQYDDSYGETPKQHFVSHISNDAIGEVQVFQQQPLQNLNNGDFVTFQDVDGMTQLNGKEFSIKFKSKTLFTIGDTSNFGKYTGDGKVKRVSKKHNQKYLSLSDSLVNLYSDKQEKGDLISYKKSQQFQGLHAILNSLLLFYDHNKRLPDILSQEDSVSLINLAKKWITQYTEKQFFKINLIDENLIKKISMFAGTQISPICTFWGGVATQQVLKFCGKLPTIHQWFHHDFYQVLPKQVSRSYLNTRYADYNILFGDNFIQNCSSQTPFLVGTGGLGNQLIKLLALMGVGTRGDGKIICSDFSKVKQHNLARQFLVTQVDLGKPKVNVVSENAKKINKSVRYEPINLQCGINEQKFDLSFWKSVDIVIGALDNQKSKLYLDSQCVWFEKPFFNSEIKGMNCSSQIIIPFHTESYSDLPSKEQQISMEFIKGSRAFPYKVEQLIQWALMYFEESIFEISEAMHRFYLDRKSWITQLLSQKYKDDSSKIQTLLKVQKFQQINVKKSFQKCVQVAVCNFWEVFYHRIVKLTQAFPFDHQTQVGRFWSGLRRFPSPINLEIQDPVHFSFIYCYSNILAEIFHIQRQNDSQKIKSMVKMVDQKEFMKNKSNLTEQQEKSKIEQLKSQLYSYLIDQNNKPDIIMFNADDKENLHFEYVIALTRLRAKNYRIKEPDNLVVKKKAGKITPSVATSTSSIAGLLGIQLIKYWLNNNYSSHRNTVANLAFPFIISSQTQAPRLETDKQFDPIMCGPVKAIPKQFSKWDKIDVQGPLTINEFKEKLERDLNIKITLIESERILLYNSYGKILNNQLNQDIQKAIYDRKQQKHRKNQPLIQINVCGQTPDGIDCLIPTIRYCNH